MSIPPAPPLPSRGTQYHNPIHLRRIPAHQNLMLPKSKWPTEELKKAALNGYASFLKDCKTSGLPLDFYMSPFPENITNSNDQQYENILHLAALNNREKFVAEIIKILPPSDIHKLLIQPQSPTKSANPLHIAASMGNITIVRHFLKALQSLPYPLSSGNKPWLQTFYEQTPQAQAQAQGNPTRTTIMYNSEDCALEILKMDMQEICRLYENGGNNSLLYSAVYLGFSRIALHILTSNLPFTYFGSAGYTAFHVLPNCSEGKEICRLLLEKVPDIIKKKSDEGVSALHWWANEGKLWPFECVLNSSSDMKQTFANLISATDQNGSNPLHNLAGFTRDENDAIKIAELLIKTYQEEQNAKAAASSSSSIVSDFLPWVVPNNMGQTPLSLAINRGYQNLAIYLLSMDNNVVKHFKENVLFLAIEKGCLEVAQKILEIVDEKGWNRLLYNDEKFNLLHLAPKCTDIICERLLKKHQELLWEKDHQNNTVLHSWFRFGQVWPFKCLLANQEILNRINIDQQTKKSLSFLDILEATNDDSNNPFHVAANSTNESMDVIIERLIDVYKNLASKIQPTNQVVKDLPWFVKSKDNAGTLTLALRNQRQKLALHLLSILTDQFSRIEDLLNHYNPVHTTLFIATENNCFKVVKDILINLDKRNPTLNSFLQDPVERINIMHLATNCTDKEFGKWLVESAPPSYITVKDRSGETPLEKAADAGADWIIPVMLKSGRRSHEFNCVFSAMVNACKKGHVSIVKLFMDYVGSPDQFKIECNNKYKDSPLHHIDKLPDLEAYRQFLEIPGMKDLINFKNSKGATPLHRALRSQNRLLVQALIMEKDIIYDIEDGKKITALDLLRAECEKNPDMKKICTDAGIDPNARATYYFRSQTNISDVRTTLSVVAALLATITFTAGFTIPGGFKQETGEAILAKKAAFLVFLISDTLAMCCSMLVLISLIWSMVFDSMEKPSESLFLIDRSMVLLLLALYSTLLAFMTGVYVVTSPKSLWAAIIILFMCSLLVFAASKSFLYKILQKIIPSAKRKPKKNV